MGSCPGNGKLLGRMGMGSYPAEWEVAQQKGNGKSGFHTEYFEKGPESGCEVVVTSN